VEGTLFSILNGLGKQGILLRNTVLMSLIDVITLYTLLGIREINIYGYAVNFVISPLAGCILNYLEIKKITDVELNYGELLLIPLAAAVVEAALIKNIRAIVSSLIPNHNLITITLLAAGVLTYTVVLLAFDFYKKSIKKRY
jgi:stage V sporulation protein B